MAGVWPSSATRRTTRRAICCRASPVDRVLIVRLGSLGDVIHAIPVAAALRNRYPSAHIDWAVDPAYVDLLGLVEALDRRIPLDPRQLTRSPSALVRTIRDLRSPRYDAVVDLQGLVTSALVARAAGARRTIGFPRAHLREPGAAMLYTDTPDPGDAAHVIHKNLALLQPFDVRDHRILFPLRIEQTPAVAAVSSRMGNGR